MFGKLKEKLKNFFSKVEKEEEKEEEEIKKIEKTTKKKEIISKKEEIKKEPETIGEKIWEDIEKEEPKKGFFAKFKDRFKKRISEEKFDELWKDLEEVLFENNVALEVVNKIKSDLKKSVVEQEIKKSVEEDIEEALKNSIKEILKEDKNIISKIKGKKPFVIVFFGINGTGKTTSIAKLSHLLKKNKLSCVLAAGDTFRAASIEQLNMHASKLKVPIIKGNYGSDPASIAFDAIAYAKAHSIDVVLIDTAGRMHTQTNLIREMGKIVKVANPDLKIFVGEAIAGNDIVEQVKIFDQNVGIDGIILSKSDIDEKGGAALSVSYTTNKPILFLGTGQEYENLEVFDKEKMIKRIFE
jgi:fused signal recognition particle receptor